MMSKINKILIANRGEIAVRVIKTARSLGFRTVAVYSDADQHALHVQEADQAVCIGRAAVAESYLVVDKIIAAAIATGADAIHPGYGFLSENAEFAIACEQANITFIGPSASAIELMGSKRLSKIAMIAAGVPCIRGYQGVEQADAVLIGQADEVGFPLMVKASAGGGGRGMRLVLRKEDLAEQIKTARSEAQNAFGSGELILERAVLEPRHIEIQVFADEHGNAVYLAERDCSIQRRHQKVVEEAPSPFVDEELRQRMGKAAVDAALSCQYRGAGTVEFLVDKDKNFYFLEMNTRLQVEHPVTELITGQDLVAWQLQVASGEPLPLTQSQISISGHAVEVRLYAEDPRNQFLPQTGHIKHWQLPRAMKTGEPKMRAGIRIDHCLQAGQVISPHYDPMIAKVIAFGDNRQLACRRLASAVQDIELLGVNNNKLFLQNILRHPVFLAGEATTAFIEQHFKQDISLAQKHPSKPTLARAAIIYALKNNLTTDQDFASSALTQWQSTAGKQSYFTLDINGEHYRLKVSQTSTKTNTGNEFLVSLNDANPVDDDFESMTLTVANYTPERIRFIKNNVLDETVFSFAQNQLVMDDGRGHFIFDDITYLPANAGESAGDGQIKASMDGAIIDVLVAKSEWVNKGQIVVVLEAMKMEHQLRASCDGVVENISTIIGNQVKTKQLLLTITPDLIN